MRALAEGLRRAQAALAARRVVLLPDLFIDRFVPVAEGLGPFQTMTARVHAQGGGNVLTAPQRLGLGGDAANAAHALARLGVSVRLVAAVDPGGRRLAEDALGPLGAQLDGLQEADRSPSTVALEFSDGANVMLSDPGPVADFGPERLTRRDWRAVASADAVVVGNWSQNRRGSELLRAVLDAVRGTGIRTVLDTGDPVHRGDEARTLVETDGPLKGLFAWSLNGHEAMHFAALASGRRPSSLVEAIRVLGSVVDCRLDIHTSHEALTFQAGGEVVHVRLEPLMEAPKHRTGAGDAWTAGSLVGDLLELAPVERLALAHAVASGLLASEEHVPPTLPMVIHRLEQAKAPLAATVTNL